MTQIVERSLTYVAEKALEKGFEKSLRIVRGRFRKKILNIKLQFCLLFRFYTYPKYDECILELEGALKDLRETNKIIKWGKNQYQYRIGVSQSSDVSIPFLFDQLDNPEEGILESILASSARIYLIPIMSEEITVGVLEQILLNTYTLLRNIESEVRNQKRLEIQDAVKFIKLSFDEKEGLTLVPCAMKAVTHIHDSYNALEKQRILEIQVEDSSEIQALVACLRG
ncbi:MAG: hypothetical protein QXH67_00785 [Candidatus Bathyarchaeia archaeon]